MATFLNTTAIADSQRAFSLGVAINAKGVKLSHPLTAAAAGRSGHNQKPRARRGSRTRCRPPKRVSARQLSPLYPQLRAFRQRCPLSRRFRLLHPQEQTFLVVSPKVRC